jgi:hypothetical protein
VKLVACREAFNRDDVLALAGRRQRQTGQDTLAVDDDRAGTARALIATFLSTGQTEHVAQRVQQREARVYRQFVGRVVHTESRVHGDHLVPAAFAPSFRASMALTVFASAPPRTRSPKIPSTNPSTRPLMFLPSRTTTASRSVVPSGRRVKV